MGLTNNTMQCIILYKGWYSFYPNKRHGTKALKSYGINVNSNVFLRARAIRRTYYMDAQLKKGLLEICVLSSIEKEESYGYKIISDLAPYIEISESTLYPILRRLESSGAVTTHSIEYNGRLRKYFRITAVGIEKIEEFIETIEEFAKISSFITRHRRRTGGETT